jgi:hypothetical protein
MSWPAVRAVVEVGNAKCASPSQFAVLVAIANHVGKDFRGCYASQETLAGEAHMSVRSLQRQIAELEALKLIEPGDPGLVAHIRLDRRPDVWDLGPALTGARRQDVVSSTTERGDNLSANGATDCRTNLKSKEEPKNLRAPGAAAAAPSDDADASSGVADAPHGATESQRRERRNGPAAAARDGLPRVTYRRAMTGQSDDETRAEMYSEANALSDEAAVAKLAQLRAYRPDDSRTYEACAREHFAEHDYLPGRGEIAKMTIMYAIQQHSATWPMFVDPAEPVDISVLVAYEQTLTELRTAA